MKLKLILLIIFVVVFYIFLRIVGPFLGRLYIDYRLKMEYKNYPAREERARILPRELCPCWSGVDNVCLPQEACI